MIGSKEGESVTRTLKAIEAATAEWIQRPNGISFDSEADGLASLFATPDNQYVGGWYKLAEDEALVMTGRAPKCRYCGVQLWSREFLYRPVCLNHSQMKLRPMGRSASWWPIGTPARPTGWIPVVTAKEAWCSGG